MYCLAKSCGHGELYSEINGDHNVVGLLNNKMFSEITIHFLKFDNTLAQLTRLRSYITMYIASYL